jgi:hypothetical protein
MSERWARARAMSIGPRGVAGQAHELQRFAGRGGVGVRRRGEEGDVGRPAHEDEIQDGVVEGGAVLLGDEGQAPGALRRREGGQISAVDEDRAARGREDRADAFEERGLARAVGADDRGQAGAFELERRDAELESLIAVDEVPDRDAHSQILFDFRRRTIKNGMPMRLVKIPTGSSNEAMLRARSSARTR